MKSWRNNYRELQRRAQFKLKELQSAPVNQKRIERQLRDFVERQKQTIQQLDQKKIEHQIRRFVHQQKQTFQKINPSQFQSQIKRVAVPRGKSTFLQIVRNPTYQKFENWWEHSPCPATVVILGLNSFVFLLWYVLNLIRRQFLYFRKLSRPYEFNQEQHSVS